MIKKTAINFSNNNYSEYKMDNSDYNKLINLNQYDHPNKFYKIGPYILDKVIGQGNFSVVKLAVHTPTQMQVAIKILHKSKMTKETLEKTYREVYIMKQLSHPYIVRLYQVIDSADWLFIVMEYALNGELFDHLSHVGRFCEKDARNKFKQILDAVEYCHKMNIVHRDLKAENLLLDKFQNIKLADFGFGSFYENTYLLSTWCGSPPYAAPELFKGEPYIGPKADIWSLGVILYAMVCGTLPFDEPSNIVKLREQVLSGWVRFPYFLSYECEHLIRLILNRSPMKRPTITTIKNHKWMQPLLENSLFLLEQSRKSENEFYDLSSQTYPSQRCNTLGGDSGFDEPINDFHNSNPSHVFPIPNVDFKDYEFNEHSLQIMERCGLNRIEICEELINKKFGSHTATYLLLGERLRIHRQSYPPLKQDTNNNDNFYISQSKIKSGLSHPIRFTTDFNLMKPCSRDLLGTINSDAKHIPVIEKNYVTKIDRSSPYENIKVSSQVDIDRNHPVLPVSNNEIVKNSFKPYIPDQLTEETANIEQIKDDSNLRNTASVIVDVQAPLDQCLKEKSIPNENWSLTSFQINENGLFIPKSRSSNSPEYVLSYPRRALISRPNSNFAAQPCLVMDSSRTFNDSHITNGIKFSGDSQLISNYNPYSNFSPLQQNTAFQGPSSYQYTCTNHNRKTIATNPHQQVASMKPIMVASQSNNASSRFKNSSYQGVRNDISTRDQRNYIFQSPHRNKCANSNLLYDNDMNGARIRDDFIPKGFEIKADNFNHSLNTVVQLENHFKKLQLVNPYNTPLMVRANQYEQYNEPMIPFQPPSVNNSTRYSLPDNQKSFVPHSEIPSQRIPAFNVIPISKFAPIDMDYIKFS